MLTPRPYISEREPARIKKKERKKADMKKYHLHAENLDNFPLSADIDKNEKQITKTILAAAKKSSKNSPSWKFVAERPKL